MRMTKQKWAWLSIIALFVTVRMALFVLFYLHDGWKTLYAYAQPTPAVLKVLFHEPCDWHPPLYYAFTSALFTLFGNHWAVYAAQILLTFIGIVLAYRIARMYFSENTALASALLLAVEPYTAFHNFTFASDNLFIFLIVAAFYYFFHYLRYGLARGLYLSSVFFGLAALTRPNSLLLVPVLAVLLSLPHAFPYKSRLEWPFLKSTGKSLKSAAIFILLFLAVITPWIARNRIVYGRWTMANIMATNVYFYNIPPLLALTRDTTYDQAFLGLKADAERDLGENVGDQGDCSRFSQEEFGRQLDYFSARSKDYILEEPSSYLKLHLIKSVPYFFQSGLYAIYTNYRNDFSKPDITLLMAKGDIASLFRFIKDSGASALIYLGGTAFWGLASFSILFGLCYSLFRDRRLLPFFMIAAAAVAYDAIVTSPFSIARYRLAFNFLFFIPLCYFVKLAGSLLKRFGSRSRD